MDISDLDIYNDLDGFQEQEEKKSAELLALETKYKESLETIKQMELEIKTLQKKQRIIEVNFQNLLDTAKTEIKRKDKQILQLRKEKDDICFRRRNPYNWSGFQEHLHPRDADFLQQEELKQQWELETQLRHENPFSKKPVHTITAAHLLAKNSSDAVEQLPAAQSAEAVSATKRQRSPVAKEDSETPKIDKHYDKKMRIGDQQQHKTYSSSSTYSCSGDDNAAAMSSNKSLPSRSRERQINRYNDEPRSRSGSSYNCYKNKRGSDAKQCGSFYQRERSRGRREHVDAGDYEPHHRRRRSRSRQRGRQRERSGGGGYDQERQRHRASREKELQSNRKHPKYPKAVSDEDLRKESSHTEGSRESSKESYKKYEHKMIERHEAKHERIPQRNNEKDSLKKGRTLQKSQEIPYREEYKSKKSTEEGEMKVLKDQKNSTKKTELTCQDNFKKLKLMETSDTNVKFCSSSEESKCLKTDISKHTKNIEAVAKIDVAHKSTNSLKQMAKAIVLDIPEEELKSSEAKLKSTIVATSGSTSSKATSIINKQHEVDAQAETEQLEKESENIYKKHIDIPKNTTSTKNFEILKSMASPGSSKAPNILTMATNIMSQNSNKEFDEICNRSQMEIVLNTPKKVELFNEIFGPSPGAKQLSNSKLLTNVLHIFNSSSASTSPSNFSDVSELDKKYIEQEKQPVAAKDVEVYFDELKKTAAESKEAESIFKNVFEKETEELIPGLAEVEAEIEEIVSEQNEAIRNEMKTNVMHLQNNEVIEIEDDSDGTDEEIVFAKVESVKVKHNNRQSAPEINSSELCTEESTKEVAGRMGKIVIKTPKKNKKPVIEIIEDIRLPTMLPIKHILKVQAENAAIEKSHSENVDVTTHQNKEGEEENVKYGIDKACYNPNASSINKTEQLSSDDNVKTAESLTTISIDDDDDYQVTNEDDKKDNDSAQTIEFGLDIQTNTKIIEKNEKSSSQREESAPEPQKMSSAVPNFEQKIAANISSSSPPSSSDVLPLCKESVFKRKPTIFNNNQIRASLKGFVIPKKKAKEVIDINPAQNMNLTKSTKNTDTKIMHEAHNKREQIKDDRAVGNKTITKTDFNNSKIATNQKHISELDNEAFNLNGVEGQRKNQQEEITEKFETIDSVKDTQKEFDNVIEGLHMANNEDDNSLQTFSHNNKKSDIEKETAVISHKQENITALDNIVKEVINKNIPTDVDKGNHNTKACIQDTFVTDTGNDSTSSERVKNRNVFDENVKADYPKDPRKCSQIMHTKPNPQKEVENKLDVVGYINKSMSTLIERKQRTEDIVLTGAGSITDSPADLRKSVHKENSKTNLQKEFGPCTQIGISLCIEDKDKANIEAQIYDKNAMDTESADKKANNSNRKNSSQNEPEECEILSYKTGRLLAKGMNKRTGDEVISTLVENIQNNQNVCSNDYPEDCQNVVDVKAARNLNDELKSSKIDTDSSTVADVKHKRCNKNISSIIENQKIKEDDAIISETFVITDSPSKNNAQTIIQKDVAASAKPDNICNIPDIENNSQMTVAHEVIVKKNVDGMVKSAGTDILDTQLQNSKLIKKTDEKNTKIMHVSPKEHTRAKSIVPYKVVIDDNLEHIKNVPETDDSQLPVVYQTVAGDFEHKSETKGVKDVKSEITLNLKRDTQSHFNPKKVVTKDVIISSNSAEISLEDVENAPASNEGTLERKSAETDYKQNNGKSEKGNVKNVTVSAESLLNDENKQNIIQKPPSKLAREKAAKPCKREKDQSYTNELKKMTQNAYSNNEIICNKLTNSKHSDVEPHKERIPSTVQSVQSKSDTKLHSIDYPKRSKPKFAANSLTNAISTDNLSQELAIRQLNELMAEKKIYEKVDLCNQKSKHMHEGDEKSDEVTGMKNSEDRNYSNTTFKERNDFLQQRPTLKKLKQAELVEEEEKISNKTASPMKLKSFFKITLPSLSKERKRKHSVEKKVKLPVAKQAENSVVSENSFKSRASVERERFNEENYEKKPLVKRLKQNEKPTLPVKTQSVETSFAKNSLHSTSEAFNSRHVEQEHFETVSKDASPVSSLKTATTPNQAKPPKSKNFRRILDSSDEENAITEKTNISKIAVKTQASAADFLSPKREINKKNTKTRKLHVISVETAANAVMPAANSVMPVSNKVLTATNSEAQTEKPAEPAINVPLLPVMPIFVRAPPTPDHAIFHSEPSGLNSEASLPQFNIPQDKQYTDIDSRLQTMFQSPPYVAPEAAIRTFTAVTNNLVSTTPEPTMKCNQFDMTIDENLGISTLDEQSTILDDSSKNKSFETKRLSLGNSEYRVEKVSENVVNVFITRKRHKKKSNNVAVATKSESLPVVGTTQV